MNAEAFHLVGKDIAGGLPRAELEACYRSACGRAYYAAFGTARELLISGGFAFRGSDDDHARVVQLLKNSSDRTVQAAGSMLGQLRRTRNSSDYDTGAAAVRQGPFDLTKALTSLGLGEKVMNHVSSAFAKDPRLFIPAKIV
jgi:uncharacterized protein (UPF0332 family)